MTSGVQDHLEQVCRPTRSSLRITYTSPGALHAGRVGVRLCLQRVRRLIAVRWDPTSVVRLSGPGLRLQHQEEVASG